MNLFTVSKRATSLALATVLLLGAGPGGHHLWACPDHAHGTHEQEAPASDCSSLMDCACCVHPPPQLAAFEAPASIPPAEWYAPSVDAGRSLFGPRHGLFDLYRPTAPPHLV